MMFSLWPQNEPSKIVVDVSNIPEIQESICVQYQSKEKKYWSISLTSFIYTHFIYNQMLNKVIIFWNSVVCGRFYMKPKE